MAVLERSALAESPLADLHAIAGELAVDGFRRLRREDLIDAILDRQGGEAAEATSEDEAPAAEERPKRRRGGRGRGAAREEEPEETAPAPRARGARDEDEREDASAPRSRARGRGARGGEEREEAAPRSRARGRGAREEEPARGEREERTVEGVVELAGNGSAFVRLSPSGASEEDVYVSAAQVRRCELVSGDRVSGPVRPPRRSERYPSLVRVATINGKPAEEAGEGVRFDELSAAFPAERFAFGAQDPTVKAIEWLTPIGHGSRVTIAGPARSGKSDALRRLAGAFSRIEGIECSLVLAGVRPEEIAEWSAGPIEPVAKLSFAASVDAQEKAIEQAIEHGKRVAARGGNAVVLIDTLDFVHPSAARKALAAARNLVEGGSLTVVATASAPLGGETTVVTLDAQLAGAQRYPAIDLLASGTLRPELLVGEAGAAAIAEARAEAVE